MKKELIGKKVKGFSFEGRKYYGVCYNEEMNKFIGKVGVIESCEEISNSYEVRFKTQCCWYPAELIEQYIITEEQLKTTAKKIRRFPSGAVRGDNTGRPKPHWVSPYGVEEISMVLVDNENDFGAMNYTLGMPEEVCLESLCRHVEECKEYWFLYQNTKDDSFYHKFRLSMRSAGFNTISALHTIVLKERGYYKEIHNQTELVDVKTN